MMLEHKYYEPHASMDKNNKTTMKTCAIRQNIHIKFKRNFVTWK